MVRKTEKTPKHEIRLIQSDRFHVLKQLLCSCAAGPVTEVKTDIFVTSFGPVSDVEMVRKPY